MNVAPGATYEAVIDWKGLIDKTDAEAVAAAEVTADEITKPGETKDDTKPADATEADTKP